MPEISKIKVGNTTYDLAAEVAERAGSLVNSNGGEAILDADVTETTYIVTQADLAKVQAKYNYSNGILTLTSDI